MSSGSGRKTSSWFPPPGFTCKLILFDKPSPRLQVSYNPFGIALVNHMTATFDGLQFSDWPDMIHVATVCPFSQAMYASAEVTNGFFSLWPRHGISFSLA